jgi:hypothetical protein
VSGSRFFGLVRSVQEDRSCSPQRWIVTIVPTAEKPPGWISFRTIILTGRGRLTAAPFDSDAPLSCHNTPIIFVTADLLSTALPRLVNLTAPHGETGHFRGLAP